MSANILHRKIVLPVLFLSISVTLCQHVYISINRKTLIQSNTVINMIITLILFFGNLNFTMYYGGSIVILGYQINVIDGSGIFIITEGLMISGTLICGAIFLANLTIRIKQLFRWYRR